MSEGNKFEFNATNQQNQIGDNNTQTQNISGDREPTVEELFEDLQNQVGDMEFPEETDHTLIEDFDSPTDMLSVGYDTAVAEVDASVVDESPEGDNRREQEVLWTDRFKTLLPLGVKVGTAFATALIKASPASPVLAGLQAAFQVIDDTASPQ